MRQADFDNAFVQAPLEKSVYVNLPPMFSDDSGLDPKTLCLRLNKSLYGMVDSPRIWWLHVKKGIEKAGFRPSENDPGIYFGNGMVLILYVDDLLAFGPDAEAIEKVITKLKADGYDLTMEESTKEAFAFLGIDLEFLDDGKIKFTQHGLIKKILEATGMTECKPVTTPATLNPLGTDAKGSPFSEDWHYASIIGMLMYLAGNAHPEVQFAVHQCARFTHCPRNSHAVAVKRICQYLQGVLQQKQGLTYTKGKGYQLDCFVDADFAGLWNFEDDQDPVCVRSRTGYVMTLNGCPVHFVSKLQTEIALSTLEAEYIALSQAMRDLVPMRRLLHELVANMDPSAQEGSAFLKSTIWEDNNGAISTAKSPKMTPRTRHIAVKYHYTRSHIAKDDDETGIFLEKIDTKVQKADILTKGLNEETFQRLCRLLCGW